MKTTLRKTLTWSCAACALTVAFHASAQPPLLYDNLNTTDYAVNFSTGSAEVGDEISLSGTGNATEFDLQYYFTSTLGDGGYTGNEMMQVRFYQNNGPTVGGSSAPGTLVYDSGAFSMETYAPLTPRAILAFDLTPTGGNALDLNTPLSDFTWTVQFTGLVAGEDAGVTVYSAPVVGGNHPTYWENDGLGWNLNQVNGAPSDFGAQVYGNLIPEPPALTLIGGLGLALIFIRRLIR